MSKRDFTSAEDATILAMREGGHTYGEIAAAIGVSATTALYRYRSLRPPNGKPTCKRCEVLIEATGEPPSPDGICAWCVDGR